MTDTEFNQAFEELFKNKRFYLPIRWNGGNFYAELYKHLKAYREDINRLFGEDSEISKTVKQVCRGICWAVDNFFKGFPDTAYGEIKKVMDILDDFSLTVYEYDVNKLPLFRVVDAGDTATHDRKRVFHVPFSMRSKMSTQRYSISGFPSLYLGTSLQLCCEETHKDPFEYPVLVSRFKLDTEWRDRKSEMTFDNNFFNILDLAIKPQDFKHNELTDDINSDCDSSNEDYTDYLKYEYTRKSYLFWYPLIAACSFIRAKRDDPFSPEYIIPQMVTQWVRSSVKDSVVGIRYFSCVSSRASEMGYNYVFPSLGTPYQVRKTVTDYCARLAHRFTLTEPRFIHEFSSVEECAKAVINDKALDYIEDFAKIDGNSLEEKYNIPDGESEIGAYSFYGCKKLKEVIIPDSVTTIGEGAFSGCTGLPRIEIPDSVTNIGEGAFSGCTKLSKIIVDKNNEAFVYKGNCLIEKESKKLIAGISNSVIPTDGSVTIIGNRAFEGCTGLASISIPDSVTSIGYGAFDNCTGLANISIPNSVTSIGIFAFVDCTRLPSITIPSSITKIDALAFVNCTGLTSIIIPDSVTSIGYYAFFGCKNLTIYCRAKEKPDGWDDNWNCCSDDSRKPHNCPVVWGYTGE